MASTLQNSTLCIIIPTFNEEKSIKRCAQLVFKEIESLPAVTSVIFVNDGSSDKTENILIEQKKNFGRKMIVLTHKTNLGYGAALQTGINFALKKGFTFYLTMDSDLTNNPKDVVRFVKLMKPQIDCVKASRYIKGGYVEGVSFFRRTVSTIGNVFASFVFNIGVKDCTNGFKMVRLSLLKGVTFKENNFSIILEELYYLKKKHAKFLEIPYRLTARKRSDSHFHYRPNVFYDYAKYVYKALLIR